MAVNKVTTASSVFVSGAGQNAFDKDSLGPDSLTVDAGAYLIAIGSNGDGANLADTGAWNVAVNGYIASDSGYGIDLGNAAGVSKITIGADASVSSNDDHARVKSVSSPPAQATTR